MMDEDEIKKYLPKYLSEENQKALFEELKSFPDNIDARFYSLPTENDVIFQGDGLKDLPIVQLANIDKGVQKRNCIILSNTCDMDLRNHRYVPNNVVYAPIYTLSNYEKLLRNNGIEDQRLNNHIKDIKAQRITNILFLPAMGVLSDSIVFLDRVLNIDTRAIDRKQLPKTRLFSLSDYGFYMFIFKLSLHFLRIQENVNRGMTFA